MIDVATYSVVLGPKTHSSITRVGIKKTKQARTTGAHLHAVETAQLTQSDALIEASKPSK